MDTPPSSSFVGRLEQLIQGRWFPALFTGLLVLGALLMNWYTGSFFSNSALATINGIEDLLLDVRLKTRAETLTPSKDIVIVAVDQKTESYGRKYPEYGITGNMLPRKRLAEIIDYFADQGAKAIVLDVELRRQTDDDKALTDAIQKAGNVYLTAFTDSTLKNHIEFWHSKMTSLQEQHPQADPYSASYGGYLLWFYNQQTQRQLAYIYSVFDGVWSPPELITFQQIPGILPPIQSFILTRLSAVPEQKFVSPAFYGFLEENGHLDLAHIVRAKLIPDTATVQDLDEGIRQILVHSCLIGNYTKLFDDDLQYLELLRQYSLNLTIKKPPSRNMQEASSYCQMTYIQKPILKAAKGLGITTVEYDVNSFSFIREIPLLYWGYNGNAYTYLGADAAFGLMGVDTPIYSPKQLDLKNKSIQLLDERKVLVNWRDPKRLVLNIFKDAYGGTLDENAVKRAAQLESVSSDKGNWQLGYGHLYRKVSAIDLLNRIHGGEEESTPSLYQIYERPETGLLSFKDKIIVYGDTVKDVHRTPVGRTTYGPEVVATTLDMILNDTKFIQKSPTWVNLALILMFGGAIGYLIFARKSLVTGFVSGLLSIAVFWLLNFSLFTFGAYWIPLVYPTFIFTMFLMGGTVYRYYIHDKEKRQLTSVFSKYVSPQLLNEILHNPEHAMENLKGSKKEMTVLFTDIHNFTNAFEKEDPQQMVDQLNEYFNVMVNVILKHDGTYDKYMGDAIMAFYGSPVDFTDHAKRACETALEMRGALKELNEKWRAEGKKELEHGVGISTGVMFVGNFGANEIKNFTVMGATVNLGARLETYTREVGVDVIISKRTLELLMPDAPGAKIKDFGTAAIKGFSEPIAIYALEEIQH